MSFRRARMRAGLQLAETARAIGVSQSALNAWEAGTSKPRMWRLVKLAELYQCSTDELLKDEPISVLNPNSDFGPKK